MKKNAFTLIELLVVLAILGMLGTLASKGLISARLNAKKTRALVEMKAIETAIIAYWNQYGQLPSKQFDKDLNQFRLDDAFPDLPSSTVIISILTLANDADRTLNPAAMVFLESQRGDSDGTFVDPWGYQYRIALDTDYDGSILIAGETVRRKAAVISTGFYALNRFEDMDDLVKSWQ